MPGRADRACGAFHQSIGARHYVLHFSWKRINQGKSVVVEGIDVAVIEDGKIARMVGFFGPLL